MKFADQDGVFRDATAEDLLKMAGVRKPESPNGTRNQDAMSFEDYATKEARELIAEATKCAAKTNRSLYEEIEDHLEVLENETMGDASRVGDEAWARFYAVKAEVNRLQQFPESEEGVKA